MVRTMATFEQVLEEWLREWEPINTMVCERVQATPVAAGEGLTGVVEQEATADLVSQLEDVKSKALQVTILAFGNEITGDTLQPLLKVVSQSLHNLFMSVLLFSKSPHCRSAFRHRHCWKGMADIARASRALVEEIVAARHNTDAPPHKTGMLMTLCDRLRDSLLPPFLDDTALIGRAVRSSVGLVEDALAEMEESVAASAEEAEARRQEAMAEMKAAEEDVLWMGSTEELSVEERRVAGAALAVVRVAVILLKRLLQSFFRRDPDTGLTTVIAAPSFLELLLPLTDRCSLNTDEIAFTLEPPQQASRVSAAVEDLQASCQQILDVLLSESSPLAGHSSRPQFLIVQGLIATSHQAFLQDINSLNSPSSSSSGPISSSS